MKRSGNPNLKLNFNSNFLVKNKLETAIDVIRNLRVNMVQYFNPHNAELFLSKPWRLKGFFNLKSS